MFSPVMNHTEDKNASGFDSNRLNTAHVKQHQVIASSMNPYKHESYFSLGFDNILLVFNSKLLAEGEVGISSFLTSGLFMCNLI